MSSIVELVIPIERVLSTKQNNHPEISQGWADSVETLQSNGWEVLGINHYPTPEIWI